MKGEGPGFCASALVALGESDNCEKTKNHSFHCSGQPTDFRAIFISAPTTDAQR